MKALASLLLLASPTVAYAQSLDKGKLDQFFDRLSEKNKTMGVVTVARDGEVLYSRAIGHGQINTAEKKELSAATRFRIGSITKMFTAVMIWQLVEEGKLKLTDTLHKFYPQFPSAEKINIEHMLGHRSGLFDLTEARDFRSWKTQPKTKDEMVAKVATAKLLFEPGEKAEYSNSNYLLLGYIVEKAGGKPYQEALEERITSRIGLKDTYVGTGHVDPSKDECFSYRYIADWEREAETHLSIPGGAGALISTSADLTKFIQALFDVKLVSKDSLARMQVFTDEYGLGVMKYPHSDTFLYGHGGGIDGFRAFVAYLPEEKLAVAYTSNGGSYGPADVVGAVVDICVNKPFEIPTFESLTLGAEILDRYVGVYSSAEAPMKFTISRKDTTLVVDRGGQSFRLEATAENKFKVERGGIELEFEVEKKQMIFKRGGREFLFTRED